MFWALFCETHINAFDVYSPTLPTTSWAASRGFWAFSPSASTTGFAHPWALDTLGSFTTLTSELNMSFDNFYVILFIPLLPLLLVWTMFKKLAFNSASTSGFAHPFGHYRKYHQFDMWTELCHLKTAMWYLNVPPPSRCPSEQCLKYSLLVCKGPYSTFPL